MIVQQFQTLQTDPQRPIIPPYFLEPQVNVIGAKTNLMGTDLTVIGQYSRFVDTTSSRLQGQGDRFVIYPSLTLPVVNPAFTIIPKIGVHATQYSLNYPGNSPYPDQATSISRTLPVASLDATTYFERDTSLVGKSFIQTLEPRLFYVYIPYKQQNNIPIFDTGQTDFNFAQIFSENRFSGYDRINDANQVTAALTSRMLDSETGAERFKAMVGQRYYFSQSRVSLNYTPYRTEDLFPVGSAAQGYSDIIASIGGLILPKTYAEAAWDYDIRNSQNERITLGVRYQPELAKVLSASYRFNRNVSTGFEEVNQIDIAAQWPLTSRLFAVGRYNYSILSTPAQKPQLLEAIAGIEYNAGCWAFRVVAQRLAAISGTPNNVLFLQLELNDFASIGSNPIGLLRRSIPGYGKSNELPTSSSLLSLQ
jgi:LPS-assembly protein